MKEVLYVLSSGSWLKKEGESIVVMREGKACDRIPLSGLRRLVLLGRSSLSSGLLDFLVKKGVDTVFAAPDGRFRAVVTGDPGSHVERRMAQYRKLAGEETGREMTALLVAGKIRTMSAFLKQRSRALGDSELARFALRIEACTPLVEDRDPAKLRGLEGAATRMYFQAFSRLIQNPAFAFTGRNRRPPRDPVNAMLSYLYTVLFSEVLSAILTEGLDPWLGSLHELAPGRPALACDLMEEYRVFAVDRLVLTLLNRNGVQPEDFEEKEDGEEGELSVRMTPKARHRLIASWEKLLESRIPWPPEESPMKFRDLIRYQVRCFGHWLLENKPYNPFAWKA